LEACGRPKSICVWAPPGFCRKKGLGQGSQWDALQQAAGYLIGGAPKSSGVGWSSRQGTAEHSGERKNILYHFMYRLQGKTASSGFCV